MRPLDVFDSDNLATLLCCAFGIAMFWMRIRRDPHDPFTYIRVIAIVALLYAGIPQAAFLLTGVADMFVFQTSTALLTFTLALFGFISAVIRRRTP